MNSIGSIPATPHVAGVSARAARGVDASAGPSFQEYFADSMRRLQDAQASNSAASAGQIENQGGVRLLAEAEQVALTLRLVEQVGNRVAATIDELKQIRV